MASSSSKGRLYSNSGKLMQLEDKAFTAWMQRLTEARRNRENRVQRPYRNFRKPYNDKYEPLKEFGKDK